MSAPSRYTVLNVDEVRATRHERTIALRRAGYRVIEPVDEEEALCLAHQESPALLLPNAESAESDERLRMLADNAPAFVWIHGLDGCDYVNRACLHFLGVGEDQVRGDDWIQFLHPDDREAYRQAYLEAADRRALFEARYRLRRSDGEYRWMKAVGTPRFGADRRFIGYVGSSVDINDVQLVAEQTERESDMVLRLALDAAGMTAWHVDFMTGVVRESGQVWKLFNRPEGFVHKTVEAWRESVHPDDRGRAYAAFERSIAEGVLFDEEYRTCPDADGRVRWVQSTGTVVYGADGRPVSAYGIGRDITDRKRAEAELRQSRWRAQRHLDELALIYQNVPVGLCVLDRDFRFLRMNERLAELNGVASGDHLGRTIRDVLPELADQLEPIWRRVLETGEPAINVELRGRVPKAPGVDRHWLASYVPVRDADGAIYGIGCVVEDVTDRKRAEEALRDSESQFRAMFELAATGKTLLDARTGRFIRVNDRFCEIVGYSRDALMLLSPAELTHPDDRERDQEGFRRLLRGETEEYHVEKRYLRPDGGIRWVVVAVRLLRDADGRPWRTMAVIQDVTDRKQAEMETARVRHRLSLILNSAGEAIYGLDLEGRATFVNAAGAAMFGYPVEDLVGRSPHDILHHSHPDGAPFPASDCPIYAAFRDGKVYSSDDLVFWKKDGTPVHVSYTSTPIVESGRIMGAVVVLRDITERKRAEQALKQSEARLRRFIQEAPVAIAMFDRDMRYLAVSRRWLIDYRMSDAEVLGRSHYDVNPGIPERCRDFYRRGLLGETLKSDGDRLERPDGSVQWLKWQIQPWYAGTGEVGGIIVFTEDVTARMQAELALRESEERLRLFIQHAPAAIAMFDRDMRYLAVSRRWLDDYGLKGIDVAGRSHYEVFPEIPERWKEFHRRGLQGESLSDDADRFERADGSIQWIKWQLHPWWTSAGEVGGVILFTEDITARMQAEQLLRTATDHARVGLAVLDADRRLTFINPAYGELMGLTGTAVIGRRMDDVLGPLYRQTCPCVDRVYGGERVSYELTVPVRDGDKETVKTYAVTCEPQWGCDENRVVAVVTAVTDVTERKKAQEDLARIYAFTRQVVDIVPNFIFAKDRDGRFTLVNKAVADCYGTTVDGLIGRTDADFNPNADEVAQFLRMDREVFDTGEERKFEQTVTDHSGKVRWMETVKRPLRDERGVVVQVLGSAMDITERKQAEAELRSIAWLLRERTAPFTAPEPQPYGDLTELNTDRTILDTVGKALLPNIMGDAVDLLGSSSAIYEKNGDYAAGLLASHWCRFLDQASRDRCNSPDNRAALASGEWHCHESCWESAVRAMEAGEPVDLPCKGGIRLYAVPIKVDHDTVGCINVGYGDPPKDDGALAEVAERYGVPAAKLRELSESMPSRPQFIVEVAKARLRSAAVLLGEIIKRKRAEEDLRELTEHLEQRIVERTDALVHSQGQLRALATELNLAEQRERKRLAGELHDYLAQMLVLGRLKLGQSKRLAGPVPKCAELIAQADEVVGEALKYTRTLVADLSPPVLYEFGLPAALKWLGEQMQRQDMAVAVEADEMDGVALPEDQAVLLFQSVRELLMNAVKHAESKEAWVRLEHRDGRLLIEVRDKGKGFLVPPAIETGDHTLSSKFGLFSIRERMKALGGRFEIRSAPGAGTTATLVLPLEARDGRDAQDARDRAEGRLHLPDREPRATNAEPVPLAAPSGLARRIRVLLVDDHAMVRQGLRSVLETYADVEVVGEAWDGEEALACVDSLRPGVVVMDINMPRMSGVEATGRIKARHPEIVVIGLSVQMGAESQAAMAKAGAAALITKDAAVEELYRTIQRVRGTAA